MPGTNVKTKGAQAVTYTWKNIWKKCTFNEIAEPGCYVIWPTGDLMRIPELNEQGRPHYHMVSKGTLYFVKISEDPYITLSEARCLAADWDLPVNF